MIEARITASGADGSTAAGVYRLITALTDHRADPAPVLLRLYHERWEIESTYYALRHTLLGARVLRSKDPADLAQELWAILVCYQALRMAITDSALQRRGTDPAGSASPRPRTPPATASSRPPRPIHSDASARPY